jgi:DNA-binding NtrC family response regulator
MVFEKIIVLDDELIIRKSLEEQLRRRRYSVASAANIAQAESYLARDDFDMMFVDVRLPDGNGIDLLRRLAQQPDSPIVVIMTGHGSIESAVECMRAGAFDYVIKPFSLSQIDMIVEKAEAFRQVVKVSQYFNQEQAPQQFSLVGESQEMVRLRSMISKVAPTDATVLISGENGTGKELVANELFKASSRFRAPYIKVNCAAVSETLIESEFFGHEKGAFTGANERREGRFELAHGGTILLDEVSEISPKVQAKLLRVLQEREFERVGGNKTIQVDVRVLATTNRNLLKSVENGDFREDLYYRLNVFPLLVPPLRERSSDALVLANRFLERAARRYGTKIKGFTNEASHLLTHYHWPGNVRELQNLIERAVILTEGAYIEPDALGLPASAPARNGRKEALSPADTPADAAPASTMAVTAPASSPTTPPPVEDSLVPLDEVEKRHILRALECTGGNRTQAASALKISIRTLRNKLHQYRIGPHGEPSDEFEDAAPAGGMK